MSTDDTVRGEIERYMARRDHVGVFSALSRASPQGFDRFLERWPLVWLYRLPKASIPRFENGMCDNSVRAGYIFRPDYPTTNHTQVFVSACIHNGSTDLLRYAVNRHHLSIEYNIPEIVDRASSTSLPALRTAFGLYINQVENSFRVHHDPNDELLSTYPAFYNSMFHGNYHIPDSLLDRNSMLDPFRAMWYFSLLYTPAVVREYTGHNAREFCEGVPRYSKSRDIVLETCARECVGTVAVVLARRTGIPFDMLRDALYPYFAKIPHKSL